MGELKGRHPPPRHGIHLIFSRVIISVGAEQKVSLMREMRSRGALEGGGSGALP